MKNDLMDAARSAVKNWWVSLIIGILSLGLGIIFLAKPLDALITLSILFVAGFLVTGLFEIIFAVSNKDSLNGWGWTLASGIIDLLLGILLFSTPGITPMIMAYFVGFWIMFQSIWAIGMSCELQKIGVKDWGWLLALAILGIIFSFVFIMSPAFAAEFIVSLAVIAFILYGIFRIYLAFKFKSIKDRYTNPSH